MKTNWKPISTAPQDSTPIDIWSAGDGRLCNYSRTKLSKTNVFYEPVECGLAVVRDATHWLPIPEPPMSLGRKLYRVGKIVNSGAGTPDAKTA